MSEDVAKLMKHAHDLERRGRKMDAELTYAAASEIARLRAELTWQPIETAPKDGTWMLIWNDNAMFTAFWAKTGDGRERWMLVEPTERDLASRHQPTHWMPLPAPPAALASARGEVPPQAAAAEVSSPGEQ